MNPGDTSPSFIILFTDLSIILLTFLIFLNALALPNIERRLHAINSVGEQFQGTKSVFGTESKRADGYVPELANKAAAMSFSERYGTVASVAEKGGFKVEKQEEYFLLSINSAKLFRGKDNQIAAGTLPFLRELAKEFSRSNVSARVAAHSSASSNLSSPYTDSVLEAASLTRLLLDLGVPSDRIEVRAHGAFIPRASTSNGEKIANHRVEILLKEGAL